MKKYIKSADYSSGDDFGYGYDSNGDAIDQSTVEELYRIANQEILPNTELGRIGNADIAEDSFEFYFGGGIYGAVLDYTIDFDITDAELDLMSFVKPNARFYPDFNSNKYTANLQFTIVVHQDNIRVDFFTADVYEDGTYSSYFSDDYFRENFDWRKMCEEIKKIAEPAVREIHRTLSNL